MKIKTNSHVAHYVARIIADNGMASTHPSGALMITHKGGTIVGDYVDGTLYIFRYYKN